MNRKWKQKNMTRLRKTGSGRGMRAWRWYLPECCRHDGRQHSSLQSPTTSYHCQRSSQTEPPSTDDLHSFHRRSQRPLNRPQTAFVKHAIKMKYGVKIKLSRILIRVTIVVVTVIIFYYSNELMVIREQYSKKIKCELQMCWKGC